MTADQMTGARPEPGADFYISYASADRLVAEWAGKQLEDAGYSVVLDVWSWLPGENVVLAREDALRRADRILALCSPAYFSSGYTKQEWTAVMAAQHRGEGRLIPVLLQELDEEQLPDLLRAVQPVRMAGLSTAEASARLIESLARPRGADSRKTAPRGQAPHRGKGSQRGNQVGRSGDLGPGDQLPGAGHPGVWRVPPRNRDFIGRDALLVRIREVLLTGTPGIAILQGPGGVGKTQLSTEYAHRFAADYDTVWVIDAEQAGLITGQLAELAVEMGVATGAAYAQAATTAVAALRRESHWLLVFDNVESPHDVIGFVPDGPGHVLVTARAGRWDETGPVIAVEEFSRAESTALLTSRVGGLSKQDADGIAESLGDLPLAVAQATGSLQTGLPAAEFHRLLDGQATRVLSRGKPPSYPASLAAATIIACDKLADADPKIANLLQLCGYLAPEIVPARWLHNLPSLADATSAYEVGALPDGPLEVNDAFEGIWGLGLGRVDHQGLKLHRLTQAILRDHTATQQAAYRTVIVGMLASVAPADTDDAVHWPQWSRIMPHLLTVPVEGAPAVFRALACSAARYLIVSGQVKAALTLTERLVATWTAELGPDDTDTLTAAEHLGHALRDTGDHVRSLQVNQDTYERRQQVLGEDDPATLMSANNLGASLAAVGRAKEALLVDQDAFERRRRVLGEDHPDSMLSAANLAMDLHRLGRLREALPLTQDVYQRRRGIFGENHPDTISAASSLGATLYALDRQGEALSLERDVLERRRRVLGEDHPDTLRGAAALAETLFGLGRRQEALSLERDVLERRRRVLGDDHPETKVAAASLAETLAALGKRKEALPLASDAYGELARGLGKDHPDTLRCQGSLVKVLIGTNRGSEALLPLALDYMERTLRVYGEDSEGAIATVSIYGQVLLGLGLAPQALAPNQDVYDRRVRTLGENHPVTLSAAETLAGNLEALGRKAEAIRLRHGKPKGRQDNSKRRPGA